MLFAVMKWEFPRPVAELCADLAGRGFDILEEGRRLLVLQGPVKVRDDWLEAFVRISGDGSTWSIAVRFDGMSHWIAVPAWATYLDGAAREDLDLTRLTRFVRHRLPEAAEAIRATPNAERALVYLTRGGRQSG